MFAGRPETAIEHFARATASPAPTEREPHDRHRMRHFDAGRYDSRVLETKGAAGTTRHGVDQPTLSVSTPARRADGGTDLLDALHCYSPGSDDRRMCPRSLTRSFDQSPKASTTRPIRLMRSRRPRLCGGRIRVRAGGPDSEPSCETRVWRRPPESAACRLRNGRRNAQHDRHRRARPPASRRSMWTASTSSQGR